MVAWSYVDDIMALALLVNADAATRMLSWSMNQIYREVDPREEHYRLPAMSIKKLKVEGMWRRLMIGLGIGYCILKGEKYLLEARQDRLVAVLKEQFPHPDHTMIDKCTASLQSLQSLVGICQSLACVKPQGRYQLNRLFASIVGSRGTSQKIKLHPDFWDQLELWRFWASFPARVSLHNTVPRDPTHQGWSDAAGKYRGGIGGYWILDNGEVIWWREMFPSNLTDRLTVVKGEGDITINDLELAGIIVNFYVLREFLPQGSLEFARPLCWADHVSAITWSSKGRGKGRKATALLRILERFERTTNCATEADFVKGVENIADFPSRSFTEEVGNLSVAATTRGLSDKLEVPENKVSHVLVQPALMEEILSSLDIQDMGGEEKGGGGKEVGRDSWDLFLA